MLAHELVARWKARTTTFPVRKLALDLDRHVKINRAHSPLYFEYRFSDGSLACTEGKGRSFRIWTYGGLKADG